MQASTAKRKSMTCSIRLATAQDSGDIATIYAPYVRDTFVSFETNPPAGTEMAARMAKILPRFPWLVCEQEGRVAGFAYASEHRSRSAYQWSVDVAAYLDERLQRHGLGRALYTALLAILRRQGFFNAYAGIALPNPASVGLHETMGFRIIGIYHSVGYKLGAWRDVGWWHLALQQPTTEPAALLPLETVRKDPEWDRILNSPAEHG
jgi:L-amino acid N-acyltransferase YncA